jgi:hypothetical protein
MWPVGRVSTVIGTVDTRPIVGFFVVLAASYLLTGPTQSDSPRSRSGCSICGLKVTVGFVFVVLCSLLEAINCCLIEEHKACLKILKHTQPNNQTFLNQNKRKSKVTCSQMPFLFFFKEVKNSQSSHCDVLHFIFGKKKV